MLAKGTAEAGANCTVTGPGAAASTPDRSASQREVPLRTSPALLLTKSLQYHEVKPDPLSPPLFGLA
jgi:hypothetical protein